MNDMHSKAKQKVLQQLMDLMDERMSNDLKSKSPKFAKVDIQSDDPQLAESLKDKLVEGVEEESSPMDMLKESKEENPEEDEDLQRLLEMYKNL